MTDRAPPSLARIDRQFRRALRPKTKWRKERRPKAALKELQGLDTDGWPFSAIWLRDWFMDLLGSGRCGVSSVYTYSGAIRELFLTESDGLDLRSLDGDEFLEFYEVALDQSRVRGRINYKADRLDQLHRFGVELYNLPPLPDRLTTGENSTLVHARLVPESIFRACRITVCEELGQDDEHREALWVYLTMLYRGALRRSELVKLLRRDINYGDTVWLFIRDNRFGTNKSRKFKVPISVLLLPEERERVRHFLSINQPSQATAMDAVFHESGLFGHVWDADAITRATNTVLGDLAPGQALTLHDFRHTALSQLALVVARADLLLEQLTPYSPKYCDEFRTVVLKSTELGKDDYWCLAAMGSHGSPEVTFRNYIHMSDMVLHDVLASISTPCSRTMIRNLSGKTHATINRWFSVLDNSTNEEALCNLADVTFLELAPLATFVDDAPTAVIPAPTLAAREQATYTDSYTIDRAYPALKTIFDPDKKEDEPRSILEVAAIERIPESVLAAWMDRVDIISSLTTQRPRSTAGADGVPLPMYRHVSTRRLGSVRPGRLPRRPKLFEDQKDIPRLIGAVEDAYRTNKEGLKLLCQQWLTRMSTSSSYMPIDSPEQLKSFLSILAPALPHKRWRLKVRPPVERNMDHVSKEWRIHDDVLVEVHTQSVRNTRLYPHGKGELYLRSVREDQIVQSKSIRNTFNAEEEIRSAGKFSSSLLRFVLFFATIVYFETWELREMAGLPCEADEQLVINV